MSAMIQYVLYLAILVVLAIPLGRIHKKRHERRENFFVQSSDTVRKPDLQGYACRQRRTDDMEKICGKCIDLFRCRACFSVPAFNFCRVFFPEIRSIFPV